MFEHAADLTGLQLKVNEAERNLSEAEANAERINDLLIDVEPRLRTLERAAKQAREWRGVHERLRFLEQGYFRHLLSERVAELVRAESVAEGGRKQRRRLANMSTGWRGVEMSTSGCGIDRERTRKARGQSADGRGSDPAGGARA